MTTGGSDTASTREDELLARLYQLGTDRQAARYAASYDAEAALTRFNAWLQEHTAVDAVAAAIKVDADAIPVPFRPATVTETLAAPDAIVPDALLASATPRTGWSADRMFTELYSMHYRSLVRLAMLLVRDAPTAEEVVQDAFIAMHGGWQRLGHAENALAYLRQAVVNRSRSVLRHRMAVDKTLQETPPDMPSAEHGALAQLERSAVTAALRDLPERQRVAIVLRYYADLSEAEIATTMGISRGAVKSHTARGMAALRAALEQE
jgi:RNA polymerase sigma-70 factor (sigma-E family)